MTKAPFAKKSFGQNFLVDPEYITRIISALDLDRSHTVIEIGPGRGALTEHLVEKAGHVIAIELERDMIAVLREQFAGSQNFSLIEQDALTVDFGSLRDHGSDRFKLVANLPYYISTAILQKLIEARAEFSEMVLMFQREVADRITALPSTADRGFLTVMVEAYLETERLFDVPPGAFRPAPKVWSSVVVLRPKIDSVRDAAAFRKLVSSAFAQKRKTILNNLKHTRADAQTILAKAGIESNRRAETLSIDEWFSLNEHAYEQIT